MRREREPEGKATRSGGGRERGKEGWREEREGGRTSLVQIQIGRPFIISCSFILSVCTSLCVATASSVRLTWWIVSTGRGGGGDRGEEGEGGRGREREREGGGGGGREREGEGGRGREGGREGEGEGGRLREGG